MNQLNFFDILNNEEKYVRQITYEETKPFLLNIHYARRMPSISYAYGLFIGTGNLIGVVTYGVPASNSLCVGLAGEGNKADVLELNRLCLLPEYNERNNLASFLVAKSLKLLPNHTFVVSYADTAWSHVGYIYQATNFLYTGISPSRTDKYAGGKHSRHYDETDMRQTRSAKHRYVYLVGDRRTKKQMLKDLRYPIITPYPKGDERQYDISNPQAVEPILIYKGETNEEI